MLWMFSYGSLMWDGWETSLGCTQRVVADLFGYRRILNKASVRNWGTHESPCPTLNLVKNESAVCRGIAFEFPDDRKTKLLAYLGDREGQGFSFPTLAVRLVHGNEVLAFVPMYGGQNILPSMTPVQIISMIEKAKGSNGPCVNYVKTIIQKLSDLDKSDPIVTELSKVMGTVQ